MQYGSKQESSSVTFQILITFLYQNCNQLKVKRVLKVNNFSNQKIVFLFKMHDAKLYYFYFDAFLYYRYRAEIIYIELDINVQKEKNCKYKNTFPLCEKYLLIKNSAKILKKK